MWGHAITQDFINWEHLPIALNADTPYDKDGCWSGTAIEKDGVMYLFYASIMDGQQQVSVAYSKDGYNFEKYSGNPIIKKSPIDGLVDFRDPAIIKRDDGYYMVVETQILTPQFFFALKVKICLIGNIVGLLEKLPIERCLSARLLVRLETK